MDNMLLKQAYDQEKNRVIEKLISLHSYEMADGRQLYECSLSELTSVLKKIEGEDKSGKTTEHI